LIRATFGRVGIPQSINILQNRRISFIGIDPELGRIIIFTEKLLTRANETIFATLATAHGGQQFDIVFRQANVPHVGAKMQPPVVPPFDEHNGR
jgi:hypothetical protein